MHSYNITYLVTGGAGFIGSMVVKKLAENPANIIRVLDNSEENMFNLMEQTKTYQNVRYLLGDIRERTRVSRAMDGVNVVLHLAALKHVYFGEKNLDEFKKTNVDGTFNLLYEALASDSVKTFINVSTDKAVYPTSSYGVTKLLAEMATLWAHRITQRDQAYATVRFGNVLGSSGSVVPKFMKQIENKDHITITDPGMCRFVMTVDQAVEFILTCSFLAKGGEIYTKKMPVLNIMDLGKAIGMTDFTIIGALPGEKIDECLMTEEESMRAEQFADCYKIGLKPISNKPERYATSTVTELLTIDQIKVMIDECNK